MRHRADLFHASTISVEPREQGEDVVYDVTLKGVVGRRHCVCTADQVGPTATQFLADCQAKNDEQADTLTGAEILAGPAEPA